MTFGPCHHRMNAHLILEDGPIPVTRTVGSSNGDHASFPVVKWAMKKFSVRLCFKPAIQAGCFPLSVVFWNATLRADTNRLPLGIVGYIYLGATFLVHIPGISCQLSFDLFKQGGKKTLVLKPYFPCEQLNKYSLLLFRQNTINTSRKNSSTVWVQSSNFADRQTLSERLASGVSDWNERLQPLRIRVKKP